MKPINTTRCAAKGSSPSPKTAAFLTLLFIATTASAWSWFHLGNSAKAPGVTLRVRRDMPGFGYSDRPLTVSEREMLATTNLFSGDFTNAAGDRYTVFFAEWRPESGPGFLVLHTPDVCWVSSGAVPQRMGQPDQLALDISGHSIPFECRIYELPNAQQPEATVWCAIVGGHPMPESPQADSEYEATRSSSSRTKTASRRRMIGYFFQAIRDRTPALERKQFARFSTPVRGDTAQTLDRLRHFGETWLQSVPPETERNTKPGP